jgi:arsenate reductase (glutaredoxin)
MTMTATIWHNPNCSTSRKVLDTLREGGRNVTVIDYLNAGWDESTLARLFASAGLTPAQALRTRGNDAIARDLAGADNATVIAAMIAHPVLVERPFVETPRGVALCRPADTVLTLL